MNETNWFEDVNADRVYIDKLFADTKEEIEKVRKISDIPTRTSAIATVVSTLDRDMKRMLRLYEAGLKRGEKNETLVEALYEAREQITALQEEVNKLSAPPSPYGTFHSLNEDGTVNILSQGRKVKVNLHPAIKPETLKVGQELLLNEGLNVVATAGYEEQGEAVVVKDTIDDTRLLVTCRADEDKVCVIAEPLRGKKIRVGDHLMMDEKTGYLYEKLPKAEVEELALEEVPDIRYEDIGGLAKQIEALRDAVELPYLYGDLYKEHKLAPPKGVLLYGPPGCGKTMVAKAIANNLARKASEKKGETVKGFFLNIKGPELLNKYVGETERKIREVFLKAKEKASEDMPVVVFFDEMDALFSTRGTGISSDVNTTIVPQLLSEIDGVEGLKNIIVIGASNRQDLIDPAVLRPGRLDVKIKIERPNAPEAFDILCKYSKAGIPLHPKFGPFPKRYDTPNRLKQLLPDEWGALDASLAAIRETLKLKRYDLGKRKTKIDKQALESAIAGVEASTYSTAEKTRMIRDLQNDEWEYESWELETEEDAFNYLNYKTVEGMFVLTPQPVIWLPTEGEPVVIDTRFLEVTYANGERETLYHKDFISGAMLESIVRRAKKRALKRYIETKVKGVMMVDYWLATREELAENEDLPNTTNPDDWARIQGRKGERVMHVRPIASGASGKLLPPPGSKPPKSVEKVVNTGQYL